MTKTSGSHTAAEVTLCAGKSCVKRAEYPRLLAELEGVCSVSPTRCLGVCKGPVAIVGLNARKPRVFVRLRKPKQIRDLARFAAGSHGLSSRLKERELRGPKLKGVLKRAK